MEVINPFGLIAIGVGLLAVAWYLYSHRDQRWQRIRGLSPRMLRNSSVWRCSRTVYGPVFLTFCGIGALLSGVAAFFN